MGKNEEGLLNTTESTVNLPSDISQNFAFLSKYLLVCSDHPRTSDVNGLSIAIFD